MKAAREVPLLFIACLAIFILLGLSPKTDRLTWFLENAPVVLGLPVLVATRARFPFSPLAYRLLFLHAILLMVGGHYSYEKVPLGEWVRDSFGLARNHYDRLGHFVQGFVPAIVVRELLIRLGGIPRGRLLSFLAVAICLAGSACYELFEWRVALATGSGADAFLATQGDPWDTQTDMALALIGASLSLVFLSGIHDRSLGATGEVP